MNYFILCCAILASMVGLGQTRELKHYQRFVEFDKLIIPQVEFVPSKFNIVFPDSLYDVASLSLKKVKLKDSGLQVGALLKAEKGRFIEVVYQIKNIRLLQVLVRSLNNLSACEIVYNKNAQCFCSENQKFSVQIVKFRRRFLVKIESKPCYSS